MSNKILQRVSTVAIMVLLITGLGGHVGTALFNSFDCRTEVLRSAKPRNASPGVTDVATLVAGNSAFAFDLYRAVQENTHNLFYSPYSISLALAMSYAGARGETERQMAQTLHFTLPQDRLHRAFNALDLELARRGEAAPGQDGTPFRLNIANALWGQLGYPFRPEFLEILAENYGAGMRLLDFQNAPEDCRVVINNWVSEQTEGKIKDLLPPGIITPETRLVLTNAIYFKASWSYPFNKNLTRDGVFHLLDGRQVTVPMMVQPSAPLGYAKGADYQAVELPYVGEKLSMVILLPAAGQFEAFERALNAEKIATIVGDLRRGNVSLTMPKFRYESRFKLKDTLAAMGMADAFSDRADFSGMTEVERLKIEEVVHQGFVAVDEAGTEAAAATAVIIMPPSLPVGVKLDRPFIFLIRDIETGAILFVGRVVNPGV